MLQLIDIHKSYVTGDFKQEALDGVSLNFRECEFAAILGQSGSGKTTMLNIIGGLDQYTKGELIINQKSTKKYKSRDWDTYRNHSIGFVFQNYNLIPHQTVLSNVELALTLSGVSKAERRKRAKEVLEKVGLKDQMHKKPNQMSGGQMQRVAIARALINNPDILLADEPTGALDSETSILIMELLKEIAKDRLIIMVTHNPEIATEYANRIIKLKDGRVVDDSNPYTNEQVAIDIEKKQKEKKQEISKGRKKKTSMSFLTAFALSMNNLMTKKGRTIMTAFAGSIGIIGIALIMSVSNGVQLYIDRVEEDTLSSYPITIESETVDMSSMINAMMGDNTASQEEHDKDAVYSNDVMIGMMSAMTAQVQKNDLTAFKDYIESDECDINKYLTDIKYGYDFDLQIFDKNTEDGILKLNPANLMAKFGMSGAASNMTEPGTTQAASTSVTGNQMMGATIFEELLGNQELLESQYEVIAGHWPQSYDEVVVHVDENNEVSDYELYSLGLMSQEDLMKTIVTIYSGGVVDNKEAASRFTYEDILNVSFKLILNTDYYAKNGTKWEDCSDDNDFMKKAIDQGITLKVVGIIRPVPDATSSSLNGTIGYTSDLTQYIISKTNETEIVKEQRANPTVNVFTGEKFDQNDIMDTYENALSLLGVVDVKTPSTISLYPNSFESKDQVEKIIEDYNKKVTSEGKEDLKISYTDYVGLLMSSVTVIVDVISYVLIAFVAISLIVSSIMIGIITYISVLERTKEIGILRSIGASKRDISRVFNAETLLVGFVAGAIGIIVTLILLIPINLIIKGLTDISTIAVLPTVGAIILVLISMFLTFIAGLIPSRFAAKRNPVEALRSE